MFPGRIISHVIHTKYIQLEIENAFLRYNYIIWISVDQILTMKDLPQLMLPVKGLTLPMVPGKEFLLDSFFDYLVKSYCSYAR